MPHEQAWEAQTTKRLVRLPMSLIRAWAWAPNEPKVGNCSVWNTPSTCMHMHVLTRLDIINCYFSSLELIQRIHVTLSRPVLALSKQKHCLIYNWLCFGRKKGEPLRTCALSHHFFWNAIAKNDGSIMIGTTDCRRVLLWAPRCARRGMSHTNSSTLFENWPPCIFSEFDYRNKFGKHVAGTFFCSS